MNTEYKFRAWDENHKHMAHQGTPDLETLQSFLHHYSNAILMLNTGKKDKKGKEIYDRDLLKVKWGLLFQPKIYEVYFSKDSGGFVIAMENESGEFDEVYLTRVVAQRYCEIVGNIYESDFYCQREEECKPKCLTQCDHCKEYYKPLTETRLTGIGLKRNSYIVYCGGSESKYLTIGKKYRLTCEPYRDRVCIINDKGVRMNCKHKHFNK
jgi:hypothetical protein